MVTEKRMYMLPQFIGKLPKILSVLVFCLVVVCLTCGVAPRVRNYVEISLFGLCVKLMVKSPVTIIFLHEPMTFVMHTITVLTVNDGDLYTNII